MHSSCKNFEIDDSIEECSIHSEITNSGNNEILSLFVDPEDLLSAYLSTYREEFFADNVNDLFRLDNNMLVTENV